MPVSKHALLALMLLAACLCRAQEVTVDLRPLHRISKYIYGINGTPPLELKQRGIITVHRLGFGNPSTTYNWENDFSNASHDWFFINGKNGHDYLALVRENGALGVETVVTVPCIGWVAKDDHYNSFSKQVYPMMQTWYEYADKAEWAKKYEDVGRGAVQAGDDKNNIKKFTAMNPIPPGYPQPDEKLWRRAYYPTTVQPKPPGVPRRNTADEVVYLDEWMEEMTAPPGGPETVMFYALDNEMELWPSTHYDLAPRPVSYEEYWERILPYAEMIRRRAPRAKIVLPFSGWWHASGRPAEFSDKGTGDYPREGELVPWLLAKFRDYETQRGLRLVDILSVHCYGPVGGKAGDEATQRWRFENMRSLWDKTYYTRDWVGEGVREPLAHIARMKEWVEASYPGTQLGITEYNFGGWAGEDGKPHMSGILTQALAFGIYGREGLYLATGFGDAFHRLDKFPALPALYEIFAKHFGDRHCAASCDNEETVDVFASRDGDDGDCCIMLINKDPRRERKVKISFQGGRPAEGPAEVRCVVNAGEGALRAEKAEVKRGKLAVKLPAYSVSALRVKLQ